MKWRNIVTSNSSWGHDSVVVRYWLWTWLTQLLLIACERGNKLKGNLLVYLRCFKYGIENLKGLMQVYREYWQSWYTCVLLNIITFRSLLMQCAWWFIYYWKSLLYTFHVGWHLYSKNMFLLGFFVCLQAMRQWWEMKAKYFDCVLFFKVGKFYEFYHMDAVTGATELALTYMKVMCYVFCLIY